MQSVLPVKHTRFRSRPSSSTSATAYRCRHRRPSCLRRSIRPLGYVRNTPYGVPVGVTEVGEDPPERGVDAHAGVVAPPAPDGCGGREVAGNERSGHYGHRLRHWLAVLLLGWSLSATAEPLVVGIFPRQVPDATRAAFEPIARYLQQQLDREVELEVSADFPSFWARLSTRRYHLVHLNQYQYVRAHLEHGYQAVLMNEEGGSATTSAIIWVLRDSPYLSIADLKGKQILFGGPRDTLESHIVPLALLRAAGLQDGDYQSRSGQTPLSSLVSLYRGEVDAVATGDAVLGLAVERHGLNPAGLRVLARGVALPQLPWAIRGDLPKQQEAQLVQAMLRLNQSPEGKALLAQAGMSGIRGGSDADYDLDRRFIRQVLDEEY